MLNQTCLQKKAVGATWLGLDAYLLILPLVNIGGRMERWEMEKKDRRNNSILHTALTCCANMHQQLAV